MSRRVNVLTYQSIEWFAVFIAVVGMGSLYFQVLHMLLMAVLETFAAFLLLIRGLTIKKKNTVFFLGLTIAFLLTIVVNFKNGFYLNDIIIWLVNIFFIIAKKNTPDNISNF